jgi:1-acyl-sn-glycerol-3-phosphate acyltransferase
VAGLLRGLRGALSLLAVVAWLAGPGVAILHLVYLPRIWLRPRRRRAYTSAYMKLMSRGILGLLALGGARFRRSGRIPTDGPVLIVMNHQSLIDIPTATLMAEPNVPAFVTRRRYRRFIPSVSPAIRLLDSPIVDPENDPRGAIEQLRRAATTHHAGLLIFPEGHRTSDGEVQPFRTAGLKAILAARRMPVYLVVSDGVWKSRRFFDFVFSIPRIRGEAEVLGPFEPPADDDDLVPFIRQLRERLVAQLHEMRRRQADAA